MDLCGLGIGLIGVHGPPSLTAHVQLIVPVNDAVLEIVHPGLHPRVSHLFPMLHKVPFPPESKRHQYTIHKLTSDHTITHIIYAMAKVIY